MRQVFRSNFNLPQAWLRKLLLCLVLATAGPVLLMRWLPPPTSAFMLRAQFLAWHEGRDGFSLRHRWVDRSAMAASAGMAVIAAEDQLFFQHWGFDFDAMVQAFKRNANHKMIHGGSTITQQTAKNLFLFPARSFFRKGLEAVFTVWLELLWPKSRILEVYLNSAQFGEGIFGVEAASQAFFGKPASRLLPTESALLAAVLPNPVKLRVDRPSAYVIKRRDWILRQMRQLSDARASGG